MASTFFISSLTTSQGGLDIKKAMSRTASRRLLAQSPQSLIPELAPTFRLPLRCLRPFSNTTRRRGEEDDIKVPPSMAEPGAPSSRPYSFPSVPRSQSYTPPPPSPSLNPKAATGAASMAELSKTFGGMTSLISQNRSSRAAQSRRRSSILDTLSLSSDGTSGNLLPEDGDFTERAHQLHIMATRHNCHITVVRPPGYRNPLNGNVSNNRTDSAFQLASYVMGVLKSRGHIRDIQQLEVYLRGFGAGREAVTKALLGLEGAALRGKIVKVSDATRLKFGGTRSKKPRRLG